MTMADDTGHGVVPVDRARLESLAGLGLSDSEIAEVMEIEEAELVASFRSALAQGRIKANARVAENLYRKATGEGREAVTAAIFWLKTRARWKETSVHEHSGEPLKPVIVVTGVPRPDDAPDAAAVGSSPARCPQRSWESYQHRDDHPATGGK